MELMHKLNLPYHESGFAMCMFNDGVNCKLSQLKSGSQNYTKEEKKKRKGTQKMMNEAD